MPSRFPTPWMAAESWTAPETAFEAATAAFGRNQTPEQRLTPFPAEEVAAAGPATWPVHWGVGPGMRWTSASGRVADFHLQAVEHARHTHETGAPGGAPDRSGVADVSGDVTRNYLPPQLEPQPLFLTLSPQLDPPSPFFSLPSLQVPQHEAF